MEETAHKDTLTLGQALEQALAHHRAGRMRDAEKLYRAILQARPNQPEANHNLGLMAFQVGQYETGLNHFYKALEADPHKSQYWHSHIEGLLVAGNIAEARNVIGAAIQLGHDGPALQDLWQRARIAAGGPPLPAQPLLQFEINRLADLTNSGQAEELERQARLLLGKRPYAGIAWKALGASLQMHGKDALTALQNAAGLLPNDARAHFDLGRAYKAMGKFDNAVASYRRALEINPNDAMAHNNLANLLGDLGRVDDAIASYRRAVEIKPDYVDAYFNLGNTLEEHGQIDDAIANYRRAVEIKPGFTEAHHNLAKILKDRGKLDEAVQQFNHALSVKPELAEARSTLLFLHSYHAALAPHSYLAQARDWERYCIPAHDRKLARDKVFRRAPVAGRRLRVGYVSGDYLFHAVSYFIEQLFSRHDRARLELFAYSNNTMRDAVTDRLQALVDHWVPVAGMPDAAVLDRIESDKIDVLIDLSGHTGHNCLKVFARRAAPVQANYLGYFASTGLTEMDYWIGDEILTPDEMDDHFSEQVWRLPRVWVSYKTIADAPKPDWEPAADGTAWVGSFNGLGKITPQTLALWAKVLHALPEGKLLLKTKELADAGNRQRILDALAAHGITQDRIELQPHSEWVDYMAEYNRLDIALDPVGGHGGGTITCDALWMGVPVIHALGDRATSRFTASMLDAIGRPEWIAHSEDEYVEKVVALARDVEHRKALRSCQRELMAASPLCDAKDLAMSLENAYFEMLERWLEKQHGGPTLAHGMS